MKPSLEPLAWAAALLIGCGIIVGAGMSIGRDLLYRGSDPQQALLFRADSRFRAALSSGKEASAEDLKGAEKDLEALLAQNETTLHRRQLGTVLEMQGRTADALLEYAKAHLVDLEEKPDDVRYRDSVKALKLVRESDRYRPDPYEAARVHFPAALVVKELGAAQAAIERLGPVLPRDEVYWMQAQWDEAAGNTERAQRLWFQILEMNPAHRGAALRISQLARTQVQHEEAVRILKRVLEKNESRPDLWHGIAVHYAAIGDLKNALTYMEKAYNRGRWNPLYIHRFADLLDQDGQSLRAGTVRQQARALDSSYRHVPLIVSR